MKTRSLESLLSKYPEKRIWLYLGDQKTKDELIRQFCLLNGFVSYDGEVFENIDLREGEHDQIHMVDGRTLYIYSRQKNTDLLHNVVYIDFKKYVENRIFYIVSEEETNQRLCEFPNGIKYI